jgi:hypothetical protein
MPHVIEPATSGRAGCRGCGGRIAAGELRFGERLPNPFADDGGEMTHWFHPACGAFRRPEPFLEALSAAEVPVPDRERLEREARLGVAHHRLPRLNVAERAPSGRATCRACRQKIEKNAWRFSLVYHEDGRFVPSGFVHVRCAPAYFETHALMSRVRHFTPGLGDADEAAIHEELAETAPPGT